MLFYGSFKTLTSVDFIAFRGTLGVSLSDRKVIWP